MNWIETLSFVAGSMTTVAPVMQGIKIARTRDVAGLAIGTYLLLAGMYCLGTLIGIQYRVTFIVLPNSLTMLSFLAVLYLLSRAAVVGFVLLVAIIAALSAFVFPAFGSKLITTLWAEPVAFIYGLCAAGTFIPQVLRTHRTRAVSSLSLPFLVLSTVGVVIWNIVVVMLKNWSLLFWNTIMFLMLLDLLRLKLVIERGALAARAPTARKAT